MLGFYFLNLLYQYKKISVTITLIKSFFSFLRKGRGSQLSSYKIFRHARRIGSVQNRNYQNFILKRGFTYERFEFLILKNKNIVVYCKIYNFCCMSLVKKKREFCINLFCQSTSLIKKKLRGFVNLMDDLYSLMRRMPFFLSTKAAVSII